MVLERNIFLLISIICFVILSGACTSLEKSDSVLSTEIAATIFAEETKEMESQMKDAVQTETNALPSITCTPSLTVAPTESFPVKIGTPIPPAKAPISPESVPYMRQLLKFEPATEEPEPTITSISLYPTTTYNLNPLYETSKPISDYKIAEGILEFWDSSPPNNYGKFSPDSKTIAICRYDSEMKTGFVDLWHVSKGKIIGSFRISDCGDMAFSPDGTVLLASTRNEVIFIDLKLNKIIDTISNTSGHFYLSYNQTGDKFIITLLEPEILDFMKSLFQPYSKNKEHISISFWEYQHPDCTFIKKTYIKPTYYPLISPSWEVVTIYGDEEIEIQQMPWGQTLYSYKTGSPVHDIVFSSDGELLAAGLDEGIIKIWQVDNGKELMTIDSLAYGIEAEVYQMAFSPDNELLAVSYRDANLLFWQLNKNKPVAEFTSMNIPKNSQIMPYDFIEFSPDGYYLATGKKDGTFQIWGVQ